MLRVSLRQMIPNKVHKNFYEQDVMTKRPEQLTIAQFVELTNMVEAEMAVINV